MKKKIDLSKYGEVKGFISELPEGWKEIADEIFLDGGDVKNVMVELNISKKEHERYMSEEEYADFMDDGMIKSEAYWLKWAKDNVGDKTANASLFNSMMNRMFKWDEKRSKNTKDNDVPKREKAEAYIMKYKNPEKKSKEYDA